MKKILPIGDSLIKCYPNYGSIFSILDAYTKEYIPWIYNHFVQLIVPNNHTIGMRVDYAPPNILSSLPWLSVSRLDRDIVTDKWGNVINFLKDILNRNKYIYALMDVSCISVYKIVKPFQHEILIYGYDNFKKEIYFMDNYANGVFSKGIATFEEINAAALGMEKNILTDWFPGYFLLEYRKLYDLGMYNFTNTYKYKFNISLYLDLIEDYLNSHITYYRWQIPAALINYDTISIENVWGIAIYDFISDDLELNWCKSIDTRAFYILNEHKNIMKNSCIFLLEQGFLNQKWYDSYNELLNNNILLSKTALLSVLKNNIAPKQKNCIKVKSILNTLKENDVILYNSLLKFIKK